jgi:hypothetical protein
MKRLFRLDAFLIVVVSLIEALGMAVAHAAENGNFAGFSGHWRQPQDVPEM